MKEKIVCPIRIQMTPLLRDFLVALYGDFLDLTSADNRYLTRTRHYTETELALLSNVKNTITTRNVLPEMRFNTIHGQNTAEYLLIVPGTHSVTKFCNKKINRFFWDYFYYILFLELNYIPGKNRRAKLFAFADKYNLRSENAIENMEKSIKWIAYRNNLTPKKNQKCLPTD